MKKTIFTMCMVALSTVGFSQETTVNYEYPNLGDVSLTNHKTVTPEYLRIYSTNNLALQKQAYGWFTAGTILNIIAIVGNVGVEEGLPPLRGFVWAGGACYAVGGVQLATVNARNTKITFALAHPINR